MSNAPSMGSNVVAYIVTLLVLTPLVLIGWNVGLEPAGIASAGIAWTTALGLSICLLLARSVISAASSSVVAVNNTSSNE